MIYFFLFLYPYKGQGPTIHVNSFILFSAIVILKKKIIQITNNVENVSPFAKEDAKFFMKGRNNRMIYLI
jgi:hypothetical protein